jgi:hypothetical protein
VTLRFLRRQLLLADAAPTPPQQQPEPEGALHAGTRRKRAQCVESTVAPGLYAALRERPLPSCPTALAALLDAAAPATAATPRYRVESVQSALGLLQGVSKQRVAAPGNTSAFASLLTKRGQWWCHSLLMRSLRPHGTGHVAASYFQEKEQAALTSWYSAARAAFLCPASGFGGWLTADHATYEAFTIEAPPEATQAATPTAAGPETQSNTKILDNVDQVNRFPSLARDFLGM